MEMSYKMETPLLYAGGGYQSRELGSSLIAAPI